MAAAEARVGRARRVGAVLGALWSGFAGVRRRIEAGADRRVGAVQVAARAAVVGAREAAVSSVGVDLVAVTRRAESAEAAAKAARAAAPA